MHAFIKTRAAFRTSWKLPVLDFNLVIDSLDAATSTLRLDGSAIQREDGGSFLLTEGRVFLISQVEPGQGFADLRLSDPVEIFSRPRPYTPPETGAGIGDFVLREISAGWRDEPDAVYAMPYLSISNSDHSPFVKPDVDANGFFVLADYIRSVRKRFNVELIWAADPDQDAMVVQIRHRAPASHTFIAGTGHTSLRTNAFSRTSVAKVTTVQPQDTGQLDANGEKIFESVSTNWYMASDGSVSTQEPVSRAFGEWVVINVAAGKTQEEAAAGAQAAAMAAFGRNGETHKVEFWTEFRPMAGDSFRLRLPSGSVFEGTVSSVSRSKGDRRWLVQSGSLATTLTEKVRKAGSTTGRTSSGSSREILELLWPIGALYLSAIDIGNPADVLGFGAWDKIQGRFLFAADSDHPAGSRGGAASHTLTADELPSNVSVVDAGKLSTRYHGQPSGSNECYVVSNQTGVGTKALGNGDSFSLFPPYVSLYVWVRKA